VSCPPKELWESGKQGNCSTVILEVRVCLDAAGKVWSAHTYKDPTDAVLASSWAGGGVRQISFALLTEALRREVYTCALVELTKDSAFLEKYTSADDETREKMTLDLGNAAQSVLTSTSKRMTQSAAQEVLSMLISQNTGRSNSTTSE